ncbi:hypothetical protein AAVH_21589 [Aphelenchoides avenae]|nr:hypothetical protein AAVH_21589 [Aphelenchus avenae]
MNLTFQEIYFSGPVWTQARQFCERLNATFALITVNPEDKIKTPVCELPSSASSASGDDAPPAAPAHSDPQKPESSDGDTQHGGTDDPVPVEDSTETNTDCADTLSTWKCRSLKTLRACKAGQRLQNVQKNCAKTCGFCQ